MGNQGWCQWSLTKDTHFQIVMYFLVMVINMNLRIFPSLSLISIFYFFWGRHFIFVRNFMCKCMQLKFLNNVEIELIYLVWFEFFFRIISEVLLLFSLSFLFFSSSHSASSGSMWYLLFYEYEGVCVQYKTKLQA